MQIHQKQSGTQHFPLAKRHVFQTWSRFNFLRSQDQTTSSWHNGLTTVVFSFLSLPYELTNRQRKVTYIVIIIIIIIIIVIIIIIIIIMSLIQIYILTWSIINRWGLFIEVPPHPKKQGPPADILFFLLDPKSRNPQFPRDPIGFHIPKLMILPRKQTWLAEKTTSWRCISHEKWRFSSLSCSKISWGCVYLPKIPPMISWFIDSAEFVRSYMSLKIRNGEGAQNWDQRLSASFKGEQFFGIKMASWEIVLDTFFFVCVGGGGCKSMHSDFRCRLWICGSIYVDDLVILFGHMHIHRYGMYLTWYIGRDGICHLLKIISNFFMKSISRCAQTQTHTHTCCSCLSLLYSYWLICFISKVHLQTKIPKLTQSWVLMATKISGSFGSPQASAVLDGFRHHRALRPVIDATCSGMDLGYQILEPSCDFLELLGFFFMGEKTHISQIQPGKSRENRIDGPLRFEKMFAFLFFGVYFFLGGKILGIYFWTPFSKWFLNNALFQKSPGKFSLNNKGTFTKCRVLLKPRGFGAPWMRVANAGHKLGVPVEVYQLGWLPVNESPAVGLRT